MLNTEDLGRTNVIQHRIHAGEATPIKLPPHCLSFHQREEVQEMLLKIFVGMELLKNFIALGLPHCFGKEERWNHSFLCGFS